MVAAALAGLTSVELLPASAEHTTLADARLDLIIIGNAFLRFPPEACDELRRILCPHGWIALFTYKFLNTACSEMLFPRLATLPGMTRRIDQAWRRLPMQALFGQAIIQTLSHRQAHTQDWTAFFGAACSGIEAPKPGDPDYAAFEAINREVFDAFAVEGQFQMDFETRVEFGQPRTP